MASLASGLVPAPAVQAGAAAPCTPSPLPLPAALSGWQQGARFAAGTTAAAAAPLPIGRGATATLVAPAALDYARPPARAGAADSFGGPFAVTVTRAGRYRVALGGGAWIDMVQGDRLLPSVAHAHGPACSPIRKMVDFDLAPGRHLIQIAGSKTRDLPLMVAAVPR